MSASPDTVLVARHDLRDREYAVRIFPGGMLVAQATDFCPVAVQEDPTGYSRLDVAATPGGQQPYALYRWSGRHGALERAIFVRWVAAEERESLLTPPAPPAAEPTPAPGPLPVWAEEAISALMAEDYTREQAVALVRRYRHYTSADEFLEDLYE